MILFLICFSLVLSAFFSGMEIAFVSIDKLEIEIEKKKKNDAFSNILKTFTNKPSHFITTMLVGNSISLVLFSYYTSKLLIDILYPELSETETHSIDVIFWQTTISTLIIFIIAEYLPKVFFQIYSKTLFQNFLYTAYFFYVLFFPFTKMIVWFVDVFLSKFSNTKTNEWKSVFTKSELDFYVNEKVKNNNFEFKSEIKLFQRALGFSSLKAREVMIPRTEICAIEVNDTRKNLLKLFHEEGYSKVLVYQDSIDNIIGYIYTFKLFEKLDSLRQMLLPIEFIPETKPAKDILNDLIKNRKSITVVLDEYGGTSGIITVEDIVRELFGELKDEHNTLCEEYSEEDDSYLFSARLEVDYLNQKYGLELPESEQYETLGGLIINYLNDIPEKNEKILMDDTFEFIISEVLDTRVETVRVKRMVQDNSM